MRARVEVLLDGEELAAQLRRDVGEGLTAHPKAIRSRWIWDACGSELFEAITDLPAYYLTRVELSLLETRAGELGRAGFETIVELGSGSSRKTTVLLDALAGARRLRRFVALDVSEGQLREAADRLADRYPALEVAAVVADFESQLGAVEAPGRRLLVLLGSTLGALEPSERAALLDAAAAFAGPDGALLLGVDLVKPVERILAAYGSFGGALIANLLPVLNRELGADFDLGRFRPERSWNPDEERVEMAVRSLGGQVVTILALELTVPFVDGETLRTEISTKFRRLGVEAELAAAGLGVVAWWTDPRGDYALCLARR